MNKLISHFINSSKLKQEDLSIEEKKEIISTLNSFKKCESFEEKEAEFTTMCFNYGMDEDQVSAAKQVFLCTGDTEVWEKNILALERGEWVESMESKCFKRWNKHRPCLLQTLELIFQCNAEEEAEAKRLEDLKKDVAQIEKKHGIDSADSIVNHIADWINAEIDELHYLDSPRRATPTSSPSSSSASSPSSPNALSALDSLDSPRKLKARTKSRPEIPSFKSLVTSPPSPPSPSSPAASPRDGNKGLIEDYFQRKKDKTRSKSTPELVSPRQPHSTFSSPSLIQHPPAEDLEKDKREKEKEKHKELKRKKSRSQTRERETPKDENKEKDTKDKDTKDTKDKENKDKEKDAKKSPATVWRRPSTSDDKKKESGERKERHWRRSSVDSGKKTISVSLRKASVEIEVDGEADSDERRGASPKMYSSDGEGWRKGYHENGEKKDKDYKKDLNNKRGVLTCWTGNPEDLDAPQQQLQHSSPSLSRSREVSSPHSEEKRRERDGTKAKTIEVYHQTFNNKQ